MKPLFAAAAEIQDFLRRAGESFCFIGGVALQRWGEPRFTRDVDLTLLCAFGSEAAAIDRVLSGFRARIAEAREMALRSRVILVSSSTGIPIDVVLGAIPYEEHCVARASEFDFGPGLRLLTCSAEDLVVLKAFAGRPQDWVDVEAVLKRQRRVLDWDLVLRELEPLAALREPADAAVKLRELKKRVDEGVAKR